MISAYPSQFIGRLLVGDPPPETIKQIWEDRMAELTLYVKNVLIKCIEIKRTVPSFTCWKWSIINSWNILVGNNTQILIRSSLRKLKYKRYEEAELSNQNVTWEKKTNQIRAQTRSRKLLHFFFAVLLMNFRVSSNAHFFKIFSFLLRITLFHSLFFWYPFHFK